MNKIVKTKKQCGFLFCFLLRRAYQQTRALRGKKRKKITSKTIEHQKGIDNGSKSFQRFRYVLKLLIFLLIIISLFNSTQNRNFHDKEVRAERCMRKLWEASITIFYFIFGSSNSTQVAKLWKPILYELIIENFPRNP